MVDAGGGEQERLAGGAKSGREAGKDRLAQSLGARRAARLARADDGKPERGEALRQPLGLHRLPGALPALERDEPAPCLPGHWRARARRCFRSDSHPLAPNEAHRRPSANAALAATALLSMVRRGLATSANWRLREELNRNPRRPKIVRLL